MMRPSLQSRATNAPPDSRASRKNSLKTSFFETVAVRMLFPNERIGSNRVKLRKILLPKRPKLEKLAFQNRLEIKGHSAALRIRPAPRESAPTNPESCPPPDRRH